MLKGNQINERIKNEYINKQSEYNKDGLLSDIVAAFNCAFDKDVSGFFHVIVVQSEIYLKRVCAVIYAHL